jgi:hypothetical protein
MQGCNPTLYRVIKTKAAQVAAFFIFMKKPKIYYVKSVLPPFRGMTVPPFGIFIIKDLKGNFSIIRHELIHWRQYQRMGLLLFYFRYFLQLLIIGYDFAPMEVEARKGVGEFEKNNHRLVNHKNRNMIDKIHFLNAVKISGVFVLDAVPTVADWQEILKLVAIAATALHSIWQMFKKDKK